jgi:hypothetical protein
MNRGEGDMDVFVAAVKEAERLIKDNMDKETLLQSQREANAILKGEVQQLRAEFESIKMALAQAQSVASGRMALVYELAAQLKTLGAVFNTCAEETQKIIAKVNTVTPPITPESQAFVESPDTENTLVGPYVGQSNGRDPDVDYSSQGGPTPQEGDTHIPFAPRTKLLSETAIPIPAFLQKTGEHYPTRERTYLERKKYLKSQRK